MRCLQQRQGPGACVGIARRCPSALFTAPPPARAVLIVQPLRELQRKALWEVAQTKGSQTGLPWPSAAEPAVLQHRVRIRQGNLFNSLPAFTSQFLLLHHSTNGFCGCKPSTLHFLFTPPWKRLSHLLCIPRTHHQSSARSTSFPGATEHDLVLRLHGEA